MSIISAGSETELNKTVTYSVSVTSTSNKVSRPVRRSSAYPREDDEDLGRSGIYQNEDDEEPTRDNDAKCCNIPKCCEKSTSSTELDKKRPETCSCGCSVNLGHSRNEDSDSEDLCDRAIIECKWIKLCSVRSNPKKSRSPKLAPPKPTRSEQEEVTVWIEQILNCNDLNSSNNNSYGSGSSCPCAMSSEDYTKNAPSMPQTMSFQQYLPNNCSCSSCMSYMSRPFR